MSTREESKDFAKGGIITGPTMPMVADCCGCDLVIPVRVALGGDAEEIARAVSKRLAELVKRSESCA